MKHTSYSERQMINLLWVIYGIYLRERGLTKQQLLQANDKLYESVELHTKTLDIPLDTEIIKQTHGLMMEDEKNVLAGEYRNSPVFVG